MTKAEFGFIVNCVAGDMVAYLMEDRGISMQEALDVVYQSETYQKLQEKSTGLYRNSSAYTYEYLLRELTA